MATAKKAAPTKTKARRKSPKATKATKPRARQTASGPNWLKAGEIPTVAGKGYIRFSPHLGHSVAHILDFFLDDPAWRRQAARLRWLGPFELFPTDAKPHEFELDQTPRCCADMRSAVDRQLVVFLSSGPAAVPIPQLLTDAAPAIASIRFCPFCGTSLTAKTPEADEPSSSADEPDVYEWIKATITDGQVTFTYKVPGLPSGGQRHDEDVHTWTDEQIRKLGCDLLDISPNRADEIEVLWD